MLPERSQILELFNSSDFILHNVAPLTAMNCFRYALYRTIYVLYGTIYLLYRTIYGVFLYTAPPTP